MSLILGVNLSDRMYLASDSLVTCKVNDGHEPVSYCTKLISMHGKISPDKPPLPCFSCMFAGIKSFTDYLFREMDRALDREDLSTDINELISQIDPFMKEIVPKYQGPSANCIGKIIFAGCSNEPNQFKKFNIGNLSKAVGPQAGYLDDKNAVNGIKYGFLPGIPDQKIFSYLIDDRTGQFGIEEIGEMYSVVCGGSRNLTEQEKCGLLKYFLSKRGDMSEAKDIINFLRNQFSDTIGGAVVLGTIDHRKRLIYYGYDIDRSSKKHRTNWSVKLDNRGLIATDPEGKKYDLVDGFYSLSRKDGDNDLELTLK